jgi:hypothetical protein
MFRLTFATQQQSMAFYDLEKKERAALVATIQAHLETAFRNNDKLYPILYFSDQDTYIRKSAYIATGRIYQAEQSLRGPIHEQLWQLMDNPGEKIRQTVVNAAGEIGKTDFHIVQTFFDKGLFDDHHIVRNAVIGSVRRWEKSTPFQYCPGPELTFIIRIKRYAARYAMA